MAQLSSFSPKHSGELPAWFAVEAYRDWSWHDWKFRCGVRCRDGDLKVLDIPVEVLVAPGCSDRVTMTKRELLEYLQTHVVKELALLSLEES